MRKPPKGDLKTRVFKRVPIEARALVTIGPGHIYWDCGDLEMVEEDFGPCDGHIVRVRPPADVPDASVERLVLHLKAFRAASVRVEWPAKAAVVPEREMAAVDPHEGIREVVRGLVERANTRDREALKQAVEAALASAGL